MGIRDFLRCPQKYFPEALALFYKNAIIFLYNLTNYKEGAFP